MKTKLLMIVAASMVSFSSQAVVFTGDGPIQNIRQGGGTTLQINHGSVVLNDCATKNYAVAISTDHPNFKNLYAAILTAKALGSTVQFAVKQNECINGFGSVDTFTIK